MVAVNRFERDAPLCATEVLARDDETHMPPKIADALKRAGHWQPEQGAPPAPASWNTMRGTGE